MITTPVSIPIHGDSDIIIARQQGRELAKACNFTSSELAIIATAISELARNIVSYAAGKGTISIYLLNESRGKGIMIVAHDEGPGIVDIQLAMQDGYSTINSLGLGLPGTRRLMDSFEIKSIVGKGTTITVKKWAAQ